MSHPEVIEAPSTLLPVPTGVPAGIVRQVVPTSEVHSAQVAYHDLCQVLLDPKEDYQRIGRRDFPKKSAWRKLSVAFNVSVALVERVYERDERGRITRAEVVARATAPNGRFMDGIGACDLYEKCCPGADGSPDQCENRSQYHTHCPAGCSGRRHFSNPSHDLPSTAHTRATNRACSDLFGMGEVSAEEITNAAAMEREPQVDPFIALGWGSEADHISFRKAVDERVKTLSPEAKADLRVWVEAETPGYRQAWDRATAEAYRTEANRLAGLAKPAVPEGVDPATGEVPAESQEPAPPAQEQPAAPVADSPDQDPEEVALDAIRAEVAALHLATVKKELRDANLSDEGNPDPVRERLTMHRFNVWVQAQVAASE